MRFRFLPVIVCLAVCFSLVGVLVPASPADAATPIYVDSSRPDDTGDGTTWATAKRTIQAGVNAVDGGGTVYVAAGTYAGAIVAKDVAVVGAAGGGSIIATGVPYATGSPLTTGFRLDDTADGAELRNFTVNCNSAANFYFGVFARGADTVVVDSLTVNNPVQGITDRGGSNWAITNNVLNNTRVPSSGGGIGISLNVRTSTTPPYYPVCSNNYVFNNSITSTESASGFTCPGILLWLDLRGTNGNLVGGEDVSGNQIVQNTYTGSQIMNQVGMEIGVEGVDDNATKIGLALGKIHHNTVRGNTVDGAYYGMWIYTVSSLQVIDNEVKNCTGHGIRLSDGWGGGRFSCNEVYGNGLGLSNTTGVSVDAENNWWGCAGGPGAGGCGSVSGLVDYTPWNQAPPGSGAFVSTFTGTGTAVLAPSGGGVQTLTAVAVPSDPNNKPALVFGHGFFSFTNCCLTGTSSTVTITLPSAVPVGTQYWKYGPTPSDPSNHWYQIPMGDDDGDNVITIELIDNGLGDDVLTGVDGFIVDQGGPGWPAPSGGAHSVPVFPTVCVGIGVTLAAGFLACLVRRRMVAGKPTL